MKRKSRLRSATKKAADNRSRRYALRSFDPESNDEQNDEDKTEINGTDSPVKQVAVQPVSDDEDNHSEISPELNEDRNCQGPEIMIVSKQQVQETHSVNELCATINILSALNEYLKEATFKDDSDSCSSLSSDDFLEACVISDDSDNTKNVLLPRSTLMLANRVEKLSDGLEILSEMQDKVSTTMDSLTGFASTCSATHTNGVTSPHIKFDLSEWMEMNSAFKTLVTTGMDSSVDGASLVGPEKTQGDDISEVQDAIISHPSMAVEEMLQLQMRMARVFLTSEAAHTDDKLQERMSQLLHLRKTNDELERSVAQQETYLHKLRLLHADLSKDSFPHHTG